MLWFPELFERFGQFHEIHPDQPAGVCDVTSIVVAGAENGTLAVGCDDKPIDNKVFLYTLIIGLSCIPTSISLGLFINKLGKKFLLVFSFMLAGSAALGINLVKNLWQTIFLSCIFEALTSTTEVIIFCVIVELFPTSLRYGIIAARHIKEPIINISFCSPNRALAMSLTVTSGRLGAIVGNVVFGTLIDLNCVIPIYTFAVLLICEYFDLKSNRRYCSQLNPLNASILHSRWIPLSVHTQKTTTGRFSGIHDDGGIVIREFIQDEHRRIPVMRTSADRQLETKRTKLVLK